MLAIALCMKAKRHNFLTPKLAEYQHFFNMQIQTSRHTLKFHRQSLEQLSEDLENNFGSLMIHPKMSSEEIMYKAGQQSVVEYVKRKLDED